MCFLYASLYNVVFGIQYSSFSQCHRLWRQLTPTFLLVPSHTASASATWPQIKTCRPYNSSPLKSSWKTALTSCFLLILPMALRGMWSTTRRTWGIL